MAQDKNSKFSARDADKPEPTLSLPSGSSASDDTKSENSSQPSLGGMPPPLPGKPELNGASPSGKPSAMAAGMDMGKLAAFAMAVPEPMEALPAPDLLSAPDPEPISAEPPPPLPQSDKADSADGDGATPPPRRRSARRRAAGPSRNRIAAN